ncbi:hypothetical protein [Novosphingobium colocasiae]|uniref:Uncharacterized protein n=1 Tax=Novosphingobium colocasiae TaxID=1256513 RepID=A0A918PJ18_9SPHN|nr:hypothetical protein [Novosphingobium colocasiae]GGZ11941.1 hypothetical protein GCM10011614_28660 [Novosphingobium colocasiae]
MDQVPAVPASQEQIIEKRLVECGLVRTGISVRYERELESIEVIIRPEAAADQTQFECIKDAVGHELVRFTDGAMDAAYIEYKAEAARPQMLKSLTATLQERRLLQGFPVCDNFPSLSEYAKALEKHAGTKPGSALRVDGNTIVFDPPQTATFQGFTAEYSDLLSVVMFASVRDHIRLVFIGNGAVAPAR